MRKKIKDPVSVQTQLGLDRPTNEAIGSTQTQQNGSIQTHVDGSKQTQLQLAIDAFDTAYRTAYAGSKPGWGPKPCGMLKRLVVSHGTPAVLERIERLFSGRGPAWIKPPFTVGTLVAHFDALVVDSEPPKSRGLSVSQILALKGKS